jgi:hypothetical protein
LELLPRDVKAGGLAIELEQRLQHGRRRVELAELDHRAERVAAFAFVELGVGVAGAVVEPIARGDHEVSNEHCPPGVVDDRLGRDERDAVVEHIPPSGETCGLLLVERRGRDGAARLGGPREDEELGGFSRFERGDERVVVGVPLPGGAERRQAVAIHIEDFAVLRA